jgi:hypothetical protein
MIPKPTAPSAPQARGPDSRTSRTPRLPMSAAVVNTTTTIHTHASVRETASTVPEAPTTIQIHRCAGGGSRSTRRTAAKKQRVRTISPPLGLTTPFMNTTIGVTASTRPSRDSPRAGRSTDRRAASATRTAATPTSPSRANRMASTSNVASRATTPGTTYSVGSYEPV